jgi:hypothetical protein
VSLLFFSASADVSKTPMANTIKRPNTTIEECAAMPATLRFESEPWTSFYMAGEIIRESRKAFGKETQFASETDERTIA